MNKIINRKLNSFNESVGVNMINKLNKNFNNYICSIGEIPRSYLESLTYEEQLLWFSKNLSDVINNMEYAIAVDDYELLIANLNEFEKDSFNAGQTFKIKVANVPDLWVSEISDEKIEYEYTTDEAIIEELKTNGVIQFGYFKLMSVEALLDLSNYVTTEELNTILNDYVTSSSLSTILNDYVTSSTLSLTLSDYVTNSSLSSTLSNYELLSNKVTSLSNTSTDTEYPSAKCVYDIIGDVESLLGGI